MFIAFGTVWGAILSLASGSGRVAELGEPFPGFFAADSLRAKLTPPASAILNAWAATDRLRYFPARAAEASERGGQLVRASTQGAER